MTSALGGEFLPVQRVELESMHEFEPNASKGVPSLEDFADVFYGWSLNMPHLEL